HDDRKTAEAKAVDHRFVSDGNRHEQIQEPENAAVDKEHLALAAKRLLGEESAGVSQRQNSGSRLKLHPVRLSRIRQCAVQKRNALPSVSLAEAAEIDHQLLIAAV